MFFGETWPVAGHVLPFLKAIEKSNLLLLQ